MDSVTQKELFQRQLRGYRIAEEMRVERLKNRSRALWLRQLDVLWSVREPQGDFFTAAEQLQKALDGLGLRSAFIGGVALQSWGECRFTDDFDAIIWCPLGQEEAVMEKLASVMASRDPDPGHLARTSRMFLGIWADGTEVDISLGASGYECMLIERATDVDFGEGRMLRCCTAEDLLITKTIAGRSQDWVDVERIVQRSGAAMDWKYVYEMLEPLLDLVEKPEALTRLEDIRKRDARWVPGEERRALRREGQEERDGRESPQDD
ncbi:MAG: hypothetical protein COV99_00070 [Bacteroidetes bacterium CG12_big_fil_rev_8_21_14_0_65_60_17]|nr:MAG: hypothetical protein COV99_00070 [Bacteroidetes bacterium CG12_big_fil_rev_8_21_14_0_65_60_17]